MGTGKQTLAGTILIVWAKQDLVVVVVMEEEYHYSLDWGLPARKREDQDVV